MKNIGPQPQLSPIGKQILATAEALNHKFMSKKALKFELLECITFWLNVILLHHSALHFCDTSQILSILLNRFIQYHKIEKKNLKFCKLLYSKPGSQVQVQMLLEGQIMFGAVGTARG